MKHDTFSRCVRAIVFLLAGATMACSLTLPAGLLGSSCTSKDGTLSAWTDMQTVLIYFKVSHCEISDLMFALNWKMTSQAGAHENELFDFYSSTTTTIRGNQFSLTMDKGGTISLNGTFTSPTEVEGTIHIAKGVEFQSNQYLSSQSFKNDFTDTWQGALK